MRKLKVRGILPAAIIMLLVVLLTALQTAVAQAITNTPDCTTDQMTGKIDCGGSDIFWEAGLGLAGGLVFVLIYGYWRKRRD